MKRKTLVSWSSGKDSAWMLYQLQQDPTVDVVGLLTTIDKKQERVAMHAVRRQLLELQAAAASLPITFVELPWPCSNVDYEAAMSACLDQAEQQGVEQLAFGDLFLADVRAYREKQLTGRSIKPIFPLWHLDTNTLAAEMVSGGLQAVLTCIDPKQIAADFCGRDFDPALLADLPDTADPCGENGEFHTFVHSGPMFRHAIAVARGAIEKRDGFVFADLLTAGDT